MDKCLFKKYERTVNNSELLKPGELRFEVVSDQSYSVILSSVVEQTVEIINNTGTFVGGGITATITPAGNELKATVGSIISVPDKYSVRVIQMNGATLWSRDITCLNYMTLLNTIIQEIGESLNENDRIGGNIDDLNIGNALKHFAVVGHKISGDIAHFSNYPNITYIDIRKDNISGDISSLENLTSLKTIKFYGSIYGDLAKMPVNLELLNGYNVGTRFSWTSTRATTSTIPNMTAVSPGAITMLNSDTVDACLINLASCTAVASPGVITMSPGKTSASASAVATLTSKGYNVIA